MNVKKHKDYDYVRYNQNSIRTQMEGPRIAAVNQMLGEYNTDFVELVKRKNRVKDRTAGSFSIFYIFIKIVFSSFFICDITKRQTQNDANN